MSEHSLSLSPQRAAGLTGWFLLYQLGLFVVVGVVTGIVAGVAAAISGQPVQVAKGASPVALILVNTTAAFFVLFLQLRKSRFSWRDFLQPAARWIPLLPAFLLIMIGVVILISESGNWMVSVLPPPRWLREYTKPLHDLVGHPFSTPFVLIVVASVTEEFVFRGLILRGLLARVGPARAIAISAGLFALMHLNPWQMPVALIIGVTLGWVYVRTRSLALCVVGHGFNNALSLLAGGLPFTVDGFNREHAADVVLFQPWWFNLLGVAVLGIGVYLFHRAAPIIAWARQNPTVPPPLPVVAAVADSPEGQV